MSNPRGRHNRFATALRGLVVVVVPVVLAGLARVGAEEGHPLRGAHRVVFLGDSITYSGEYVEDVEAYLRLADPSLRCEFLNLGLPSETVSGLSEPGHAGGAFPRPGLGERLDRVLARTKPGLVVACYGMNDGIYHPFDEERFRAFQLGMRSLHETVTAAGAKILHVTPPVFDPAPIRPKTLPAGLAEYPQPFEGYDDVLGRYSEWLLARRAEGWDVVDVHGPMSRLLAAGRVRDPGFRFAGDGVHADAAGHWVIARELLVHWGVPARDLADAASVEADLAGFPRGLDVLRLVQKRQRLLKDSWLTATGHKRPGMKTGKPLDEAEREAAGIETRIRAAAVTTP